LPLLHNIFFNHLLSLLLVCEYSCNYTLYFGARRRSFSGFPRLALLEFSKCIVFCKASINSLITASSLTILRTSMNKSILLVSLLAAFALSACGKKEEAAPAPVAAPAPAAEVASAPAADASAPAAADAASAAASK
jgi:hypothetical protein